MKSVLTGLLLIFFLATSGYEAAIAYFSRVRTVAISSPDHQNYVVIDADIWKYARPDLADLRLYDGQAQDPYAVITQSGGSSAQDSPARILNLGKAGGQTEFDLDVGGLAEYDRVRLTLEAKNFINRAQVEGRKTVNERSGTDLGNTTLYDFTAEGVGSNSVLKFPTSSFPYLHVRLAPGIAPAQVKGASVSNVSETKAVWTSAGTCAAASGAPKQSAFACSLSDGVPLERIVFELPVNSVNFNRTVVISDEKGNELERSSISRVRLTRAGQTVVSEDLALGLNVRSTNRITVTVENGDDTPLPIAQVRPLSVERRIYFDPKGKSTLELYYGDAKLEAPSYDYGKFFQQSPDAVAAQAGPAEVNRQFTGRPDDRPWSERHNGVLWLAMLLAVALLGGLALRGLKGNPPQANL
jgi:Protein of unknown function (DUF3999)